MEDYHNIPANVQMFSYQKLFKFFFKNLTKGKVCFYFLAEALSIIIDNFD